MMTSTERVVLRATIRRVNHYREQKFDKYVILEYVDSSIRKAVEYINRILADEYPKYEAIVKTKGIEIY